MVRLAIRGNPAFQVNDWEIRRRRVVYTYETLEYFHARRPKATFYFILGADSLKLVPMWREPRRLRSLCRFIPHERIQTFASHDIRHRVLRRLSIRYLVPEAVERYIRSRKLYRKPE